jgi:release factor glutamine methyltransferase
MSDAQGRNTIRNSLKSAIAVLKKSEIEFPEINAITLLAYVLSCEKTVLYTKPDDIVDEADFTRYNELIDRRASHVPLQYITQQVEFMSLNFIVDERVLIPRPETEILVETVIKKTDNKLHHDRRITIIDIGTGSGNIAISLAKNISNIRIYAGDISLRALAVANENVQKHDVTDKIHLLHGNVFDAFNIDVKNEQVDFVVSNPPYVSKSESKNLEPELIDHEPLLALIGGEDGLCIYKQIIKDAAGWIKPGGYLIIEIGETQAGSIIKLMQNELYYDEIEIINDLQGKERIISAKIKQ